MLSFNLRCISLENYFSSNFAQIISYNQKAENKQKSKNISAFPEIILFLIYFGNLFTSYKDTYISVQMKLKCYQLSMNKLVI